MKINKDCKIELAASKDVLRYAITEPYLDADAKVMVATNGMILAIVPVETTEQDKSGYITREDLKAIRKTPSCAAECSADWIETGNAKLVRSNLGNFPKYSFVIPPKDREIAFSVGLNAKALWDLCQAIGCETCRLEFKDNLDAIVVKPTTIRSTTHKSKPAANLDAYGVLMPTRLS